MLTKSGCAVIAIIFTIAASSFAHAESTSGFSVTPKSNILKISDGGDCGWFAISVCSKRRSVARNAARRYGQDVINSGDVAGFSSGYYCAVSRPPSKTAALNKADDLRRDGADTAYAKHGCE
jgi:hypothetical protein